MRSSMVCCRRATWSERVCTWVCSWMISLLTAEGGAGQLVNIKGGDGQPGDYVFRACMNIRPILGGYAIQECRRYAARLKFNSTPRAYARG